MTQKQAKELLPIISAFAEGKTIQFKGNLDDTWIDCENNDLCFCSPAYTVDNWRIKPEPREFWIMEAETEDDAFVRTAHLSQEEANLRVDKINRIANVPPKITLIHVKEVL